MSPNPISQTVSNELTAAFPIKPRRIAFAFILVCMIWFSLQDAALAFLYRAVGSSLVRPLLVFKEALILTSFCLLVVYSIHNRLPTYRVDLIGVPYLIFCVVYLFVGTKIDSTPWSARAVSFRSAILPVILFWTGRLLSPTYSELKRLTKAMFGVSIASVLFGLVEMNLPVEITWNGIMDLGGMLTQVKGLTHSVIGGVPANFWGFWGRRMAGLGGSPLSLGYFLLFPTLIGFNLLRFRWRSPSLILILLILFLGMLLSGTRATIVTLLLVQILFIPSITRTRISARFAMVWLCVWSLLLAIAIGILGKQLLSWIEATVRLREGSAIVHAASVMDALKTIMDVKVLGGGMGTYGAWAFEYGTNMWLGGEITYLVLAYQLGWVGAGLFLLFIGRLFIFLRKMRKTRPLKDPFLLALHQSTIMGVIAYALTGLVSEQLLTFTSLAHFWLFCGFIFSHKLRNETANEMQS